MKKSPTLSVLVALLAALFHSSECRAFDGRRSGFLLGFGLGGGGTSFTQEVSDGYSTVTGDRETDGGMASSFMIGGGITDRIQLYYLSRVSWFSLKNMLGDNVTIASGVGGIAMSSYMRPTAPSAYILSGVGISSWATPFESDSDTWYGLGLIGGVGYEFSPHWSVETVLTWGNPDTSDSGITATTKSTSASITITGIAY